MINLTIQQTNLEKLKLLKRGKVRDIYDLDEYLLIVSTDRISAYDVVMKQGIPYKGIVLTKISEFWFNFSRDIIDNHFVTSDFNLFPSVCKEYQNILKHRSMLVKKANVIPIEFVVRGFLFGSAWNDYINTGEVCGQKLPIGLKQSQKLEKPLFTPATKAEIGKHDENISEQKAAEISDPDTIEKIKKISLTIYKKAFEYALSKGIIIADTKFEFGFYNDKLILIDEVLTPDSSRFWDLKKYYTGQQQYSFDKQYLRDYLSSIGFNNNDTAPDLPDEVINLTCKKYQQALEILTNKSIYDFIT